MRPVRRPPCRRRNHLPSSKGEVIEMKKTYSVLITLLMALTLSGLVSVSMEAKTRKPYKTQNLKLVEGRKTVWDSDHNSPIKKIKKTGKNKKFKAKIFDCGYAIRFSGTDYKTKQTVKVYYKNGRTQKFNLKTDINYLSKIKAELKPMLANPNAGLKKALADWVERDLSGTKLTYKYHLNRTDEFKVDPTTIGKTTILDYPSYPSYSEAEMYEKLTSSQKKALILEVYVHSRSHYKGSKIGIYYSHRNSNAQFKKLYNGTFKGVCSDGAAIATDIGKAVGLTTKCVSSLEMDHAWCVVKAVDEKGKKYWHGIYTTSYAYSLKASLPKKGDDQEENSYKEKTLKKYTHSPCYMRVIPRKIKRGVKTTHSVTPSIPSAITGTSVTG